MGAGRFSNEQWRAADRFERANRTVHAAGKDLLRAGEQLEDFLMSVDESLTVFNDYVPRAPVRLRERST